MEGYAESVTAARAPEQRAKRIPHDTVGDAEAFIDGELMAWGRWTRAREVTVRVGSAEGQYRAPWRQWHYPSIEEMLPKPLDGWIWKVDRAVTRQDDPYRSALTYHYARMCNPFVTCRRLRLRYEEFGICMSRARLLVLKILRD